jgi:Lrp/AsnC family transcriptional regulator
VDISSVKLDSIDRKILQRLQEDASTSLSALAEAVHLSATPCWRRVQRLEKAGVIRKRVALLDPARINLGVTAFVAVRTSRHSLEWLQKFHRAVADIPEIVEVYRMSGEVDYMLRVVVPDIPGYDRVYKKLIRQIDLYDVSSSFAMEQLKFTTALPLDYAK